MIEATRLFCDPRALQLEEIDTMLGYSRGTASRLLKEARRYGLLSSRDEVPMPRDKSLEDALSRKHPPTKFLVVETHHPSMKPAGMGSGGEGADDLLHERLGRITAQFLAMRLGSIETLGVGAGRAVFHAARSLMHYPESIDKGRKITVIGLHGHMDRRLWRKAALFPRQAIDAVRVTHTMATALRFASEMAVSLPLIQPGLRAARERLVDHAWFLQRRVWTRRPPSMVLVGMGVMGGPPALERISQRARRMPAPRREMMAPIMKELMEIRFICRRFLHEKGYIPVSDVCDRLFWVPEPEEAPELHVRARRMIRIINDHVLGVESGLPPEPTRIPTSARHPRVASLDQVKKVVMIAGGAPKARGLAKLLKHKRPDGRRFMTTLITDQATARMLLEIG